jgi:hypothetical protein
LAEIYFSSKKVIFFVKRNVFKYGLYCYVMNRAQGTIEYLVIVGIVVVIGLSVVSFSSTFFGQVEDISEF